MWQGFGNEGGFFISSFGIMLFLAFLSCNLLIKKTLKEKKIESKIGDDIVFWAAIGGIIGALLVAMYSPMLNMGAAMSGSM